MNCKCERCPKPRRIPRAHHGGSGGGLYVVSSFKTRTLCLKAGCDSCSGERARNGHLVL